MMAEAGGGTSYNTTAGVEIWNSSWAVADRKKVEASRSPAVETLVNKLGYRKNDGISAFPSKANWQ